MTDETDRNLRVGDRVWRLPKTHSQIEKKDSPLTPMSGTVVYIHPEGRYHAVEFESQGGLHRWRESYRGCDR